MYVQVYSRIINAATMQCRRLKCSVAIAFNRDGIGLFRHDVIQKKHSIIQRGIKSPPGHCIPTVELCQALFTSELRQVEPEAVFEILRKVYH